MLFAALSFAVGSVAQDRPTEPDPQNIVVTGQEIQRQVRDFVGALTEAPVRGQLGRFDRSVCPVAVGLPQARKDLIVRRLREVAEGAGLRVGGPNCMPNLVVIVTSDKRAFLEALAQQHPYYFGDLPLSERQRIAREPGHAAAWQLQAMVDADGSEMPSDPTTGTYVNRTTRRPSRITAEAHPHFVAAVVVVERAALVGLTTTQLADYAAMRTLARTDPSRLPDPPPPTILNVLDAPMGSEVPVTLTQWDLGFLRGLYASSNNLYAPSQRGEIRRRLTEELERR